MMALDARNCLGFEHSRFGPRMVPRTVIGEVGRLSTFVVSIRDICNRLTTRCFTNTSGAAAPIPSARNSRDG